MVRKSKTYPGTASQEISARELRSRAVARKAAAESIVLLKNNGLLPLPKTGRVALFGSGATHFVKGGTGSGDVNEREVVSIYAGMKNAGFAIANEGWLSDYEREYQTAYKEWKEKIISIAAQQPDDPEALMDACAINPFLPPAGRAVTQMDIESADTDIAIYVLSRIAGEGADRRAVKGDYYVTDAEIEQMKRIGDGFSKLILVLNCGGPIDLGFEEELKADAIVQLSQPGMEGGNAFADIVGGDVTPSGKMTDTWALRYEDYPNAGSFSHCNGDVQNEFYTEGIYVGYRYFDTFGVNPCIPFGFGLSYTNFSIVLNDFSLSQRDTGRPKVRLSVEVRNTGSYSGKEVVQVYASCPQGKMKKEYQRLCAFGKTPALQPGESCAMELTFPISQLASFNEADSAYQLEQGDYVISIGNSSASNTSVGAIRLDSTINLLSVEHICPLKKPLQELKPESVPQRGYDNVPVIELKAEAIQTQTVRYQDELKYKYSDEAADFVKTLDLEQLLSLTSGDPDRGQNSYSNFSPVGSCVPGSAGETHDCASGEPWNLASIVLADGPAGLRLAPKYQITPKGEIVKPGFTDTIERGMFAKTPKIKGSTYRYQYCTAFPVGTMLAQSWNTDLLREVGQVVASEMEEYGVALWLAPGMNIHRNPLCGRNFEYFSEDPLLTGVIASAIITGLQSAKGIGATIKHFACNNQEDNRKGSDSIVSERALREIYLHGFEIAVKHAQPMSIMTSYNLLNGIHTANSYDLIAKVARAEWGFAGFVMSDWVTTGPGGSSPVACMKAGNDLIMPGSFEDIELLRDALNGRGEEKLDLEDVRCCVANLVRTIWQSNEYEDCRSYSGQFNLEPYIESRVL